MSGHDHTRCLFCGGDRGAPDHWHRCDGRQGAIEELRARIDADPDLIDDDDDEAAAHYPDQAGWTEPTTSREAAATIDAPTLRAAVYGCLCAHHTLTTDECAALLGVSVLAVRPRFSELRALGLIDDTGARHLNRSGRRAIVWSPRLEVAAP